MQGDEENPPMLLKCGHVICKNALVRLGKNNARSSIVRAVNARENKCWVQSPDFCSYIPHYKVQMPNVPHTSERW